MNLPIESLFKIVDDLDLRRKTTPSLQNSGGVVFTKSNHISFPKIFISEDWGKKGTEDRKTLEYIVKRAFRKFFGPRSNEEACKLK